jgi:gas vesicle protein
MVDGSQVETALESAIVGALVGGAIGAMAGYLSGVRITKRQRLHQCYESLYPTIERLIHMLQSIGQLQSLEIKDEKSKEAYYFQAATGRAFISDLGIYYDTLREYEESDFKNWKEEKAEIERLRDQTMQLLNWEVGQSIIKMRSQTVILDFMNPEPSVREGLNKVNILIGQETLRSIAWLYIRSTELRVKTNDLWQALIELRDAMGRQLKRRL